MFKSFCFFSGVFPKDKSETFLENDLILFSKDETEKESETVSIFDFEPDIFREEINMNFILIWKHQQIEEMKAALETTK